jgi:uncharacterized protein YndB with AHSA1/START domain
MSDTLLETQNFAASAGEAYPPISLNLSASIQIKAEPYRVLYALAMPEYMEAWLQFPDVDRVECHSEMRSFDRFRLDLLRFAKVQRSIFGSCLLSKPNRITYLWDRSRAGEQPQSVVEMRLSGGPDRCILRLRHTGLCKGDERDMYSGMWPRSLKSLCGLVEGIERCPLP